MAFTIACYLASEFVTKTLSPPASPLPLSSPSDLAQIDPRVQQAYHGVKQTLLLEASQKLDTPFLLDLDALLSDLVASVSPSIEVVHPQLSTHVDRYLHELALRQVFWVQEKLLAKASTPGDKERLADAAAQGFQEAMEELEQLVHRAESNSSLPLTVESLNAALENSPLVQKLGSPEEFYQRLARQIEEQVGFHWKGKGSVGGVASRIATIVSEKFGFIHRWNQQSGNLAGFLISLHQQLCDPYQLKELLTTALQSCGESLDRFYATYKENLESPLAAPEPRQYNEAYGGGLMSTLRLLQPHLCGLNLFRWCAKVGRPLDTQEGPLFASMRDAIGKAIADVMDSTVQSWLSSALAKARAQLIDANHRLARKPAFISMQTWNRLSPERQKALCDPTSEEAIRALAAYQRTVRSQFERVWRQLATKLVRAGLVFEQFLPTARQYARDPQRPVVLRSLAWLLSCLMAIPLLNCLLFELPHRIVIYLRELIARVIGRSTGDRLAQRIDLLLQSDARYFIFMSLLQKTIDCLELFKKPVPSSEPSASQVQGVS